MGFRVGGLGFGGLRLKKKKVQGYTTQISIMA